MKSKPIYYVILFSIFFSGCFSKGNREHTITISGAFALYPLVIKWAEEFNKEHPEVKFNITGGGAGKGMADALSGTVDLGMFSRTITQAEKDKGVWWVGLTIDAVVPTISADNPFLEILYTRGVSRDEFRKIFIEGSYHTWEELLGIEGKSEMVVYTRSDACGAAETWGEFIGGSQEDLLGVGIFGDPGLADAVSKDKLGIGFNNTIYVYDVITGKKRQGIEVIPIDINGNGLLDNSENFYTLFDDILKAIAEEKYPSPPSRELYFVAKSKPEKKVVSDFIKWCLTHGQKYVTEAGYVPLKQDVIDYYLLKLDE